MGDSNNSTGDEAKAGSDDYGVAIILVLFGAIVAMCAAYALVIRWRAGRWQHVMFKIYMATMRRRGWHQAVRSPGAAAGISPAGRGKTVSRGAYTRNFFVSHTQLDPQAKELALALCKQLNEHGKTCWLDESCTVKKMNAAVRGCDCVIAVRWINLRFACVRPRIRAATTDHDLRPPHEPHMLVDDSISPPLSCHAYPTPLPADMQ